MYDMSCKRCQFFVNVEALVAIKKDMLNFSKMEDKEQILDHRLTCITGKIIISIFKEDNILSITASLPYGPPVNKDINYYRTSFGLVYCKCCEVSCVIFC